MVQWFKYKIHHPLAVIDMPARMGDVGYDIYATSSCWILPLFPRRISIHLSFELPEGYWASIETRSSHGVKNHLRVHRGILDNGWRGITDIKVYNHGWMPYKVKKGEKIAQIILSPICVFPLKQVEELTSTERGMNGFGSTNIRS